MRPVVNHKPKKTNTVVVGDVPVPRRFVFSFRFFRERRYFGLGDRDNSWFSALFSKLSDISVANYDALMSNVREKQLWRLHPIDWSAQSIPVMRSNLDWIDAKYRDNEEEFPFFQFQITKAHGRVIGFWDEAGVFNVVFLDPMHNMQPSNFNDYKLRDTVISRTTYASSIQAIEQILDECGDNCACQARYAQLQAHMTRGLAPHTMIVPMPPEVYYHVVACVRSGVASCLADILRIGLDGLGVDAMAIAAIRDEEA